MTNLEKTIEDLFERGLLRNIAIKVGKNKTVLAELYKTAEKKFCA